MNSKIAITGLSSVSALGADVDAIWQAYRNPHTSIAAHDLEEGRFLVARIPAEVRVQIQSIRQENSQYALLDESALYAMFVARRAMREAGWSAGQRVGIQLGSSRGATQSFEKYHQQFVRTGTLPAHTSPSTTLGNLSSWVAYDLKTQGPEVTQSVTCSTGLQALLNAVAWLRSGMEARFIAGACEAALTPFTVRQMQALKIYAEKEALYPCRALDPDKTRNSMVLGEGAAVVCLERTPAPGALAYIEAVGYASDDAKSSTALSEGAQCFQRSMRMALDGLEPDAVDAIVMHAPGTIQGDAYEMQAIAQVFPQMRPLCTSNKWKIGHTLGASGMLSLHLAVLMLQRQQFIPVPYLAVPQSRPALRKVLVNAVGFGGSAVSILLSR